MSKFKYNNFKFKRLLINSRLIKQSIGNMSQFETLKQLNNIIKLNRVIANSANLVFGIKKTLAIESIKLKTSKSLVTFYIVEAVISFLFYLANMDQIDVCFNNMKNALMQVNKHYQVVRQYRHAFLTLYISTFNIIMDSININSYYLTDFELQRLYILFKRSGHNVNLLMFKYLIKYGHYCQKHRKSPERFSLILKDDANFKYHIIANIMYLINSPILYIINKTTCFQAIQQLKEVSAKMVQEQFCFAQIDAYFEPPNIISIDVGIQFIAKKFK